MTFADIQTGLDQISPFVLQGESALKKAATAGELVFLDTCTISRQSSTPKPERWVASLKGFVKERTVIIITALILYELQGGAGLMLNNKKIAYLQLLCDMGFSLVYLAEEELIEAVHMKYECDTDTANKKIAEITFRLAIRFDSLGKILRDSENSMYPAIFQHKIPKNSKYFVSELFQELRKHKNNQDSLAEDVICIVSCYLLDLAQDEKRYRIHIITEDIKAIAKIYMSLLAGRIRESKLCMRSSINLLENMDIHRDFTDISELESELKRFGDGFVCIATKEKAGIVVPYHNMNTQELAEAIWNGKEIIYPYIMG